MIKNRTSLEQAHGRGARIVLGAIEVALKSVDPCTLVRGAVKVGKDSIKFSDIDNNSYMVRNFKDIYIVGAGKAAAPMAHALVKILKGRVAAGAINVPKGTRHTAIDHISTTYCSHPVPDSNGVKGAIKIANMLESTERDDLAIVLISGGGSALLPLPAQGITLFDKQEVTKSLLASGASINQINAVRKHLSAVKGGQLARRANCQIVSLVLSDVIGDDFAVIASGPTFPDPTTYHDALATIKRYKIRNANVLKHFQKGAAGSIADTPKPGDTVFGRVRNILIGNNQVACRSAAKYLARHVPEVHSLGSTFDGEARNFGRFVAKSVCNRSGKFAIVAGGETTVRLGDSPRSGKGGRNQEAALACALSLKATQGITVAFVGTDGIDGNSDAAGGVISKKVEEGTAQARLLLRRHDSYHALKKLKSLVFTGYTGTNVNDLAIALRLNG